ncbi:MAG TPA: hypothetical protein VEX18_18710 [Polyangiaceae bacterium]|nr:hypothetical protein [Polyangiaceae bacterium]
MKTPCLVLLLAGCTAVPVHQRVAPVSVAHTPVNGEGVAEDGGDSAEHGDVALPVVAAEPFSASWLEEPKAERTFNPDEPTYSRTNSFACPEPVAAAPADDGYQKLLEVLFEVDDGGREVASLHTFSYADGPELLSLLRRPVGEYVLRTISIPRGRWYELTTQVRDAVAPESTLMNATTARVVREQPLDAATARLMVELWRALIGRSQVVLEVNPTFAVIHPTAFVWGTGARSAVALSPTSGSVLGDALQAAGHLRRIAEGASSDDGYELRAARSLMRESLARTRKKEPCLMHVDL